MAKLEIKKHGFYMAMIESNFWGRKEFYLITIYFINEYIVFEIDKKKDYYKINENYLKAKYENRKLFEKHLSEGKYSTITNIHKNVSTYSFEGEKIKANFIGDGLFDYNNFQVTFGQYWLFGAAYHFSINFIEANRNFIANVPIKFYQFP